MPSKKPPSVRTRDQLVSFSAGTDEAKERMIYELARVVGDIGLKVDRIGLFTSTKSGIVPASGTDATAVLYADGVWRPVSGGGGAVSSVTAGSTAVSVSPTTGAVVVDVVEANFSGIPESAVTGLVADLAARPTGSGTSGRSLRWTGPTSVGDGAFTDNGTNVGLAGTLTLSAMTAGSVLFAGPGGLVSQDNPNLFYDDTNNRFGIGTNSLSRTLEIQASDPATHTARICNTSALGYSALNFDNYLVTKSLGIGYSNAEDIGYLSIPTTGTKVTTAGNVTRMTWFTGGNVNIGPTASAPSELLRVEGQVKVHANVGSDAIIVRNDDVTGLAALQFQANGGTFKASLGYSNASNPTTWVAGLPFFYSGGDDWVFAQGLRNHLRLGMANDSAFVEVAKGDSAAVSNANTGRLRYNTASQVFEVSLNTGAYAALPQGSGTTNTVPKWTSTIGTLGNSNITDNGTTITLGSASTIGSAVSQQHVVSGNITQSFDGSATRGLSVTVTPSAQTAQRIGAQVLLQGTMDTTTTAITNIALFSSISSARSAGANNLINVAHLYNASGAQFNVAVQSNSGDAFWHAVGGNSAFGFTSNTTVLGAKVNVNGGLVKAQAPGSFTIVTGFASIMAKRMTLTGTQRLTVQGTGRLSVCN